MEYKNIARIANAVVSSVTFNCQVREGVKKKLGKIVNTVKKIVNICQHL